MKRRIHLTWLAITALGVFVTGSLPQDGLSELELMNCQLTVRPKGEAETKA